MVGDEDDDGDASDGGKRRRNKSSGGDNKRKRLRKAREEHGIEAADDEDLELIREAQGVRCAVVKRVLITMPSTNCIVLVLWYSLSLCGRGVLVVHALHLQLCFAALSCWHPPRA